MSAVPARQNMTLTHHETGMEINMGRTREIRKGIGCVRLFAVMVLAALSGTAWAQARVQYGRITAVNVTTQASSGAQAGGALIGGTIGLAAGSGRSGSNRILGGIGGAVAGQQVGRLATRSPRTSTPS
jgi:hypothetical protein